MKFPHSLSLTALAALVCAAVQPLSAQGPHDLPPAAEPIPFAQLGAKATAEYQGDAIGITATTEGATLRTGFQKLAGTVTNTGLRLASTEAQGGSLQLTARVVGRVAAASSSEPLPAQGQVCSTAQLVTFTRSGLIEEYRVSVEGVQQDFIVATAPAGPGQLSVELTLSGATAEAAADGAKLTLTGSHRVLAYSRLHVTDATGKALAATLAVLSPTRLAVQVDDADAVYPVRIDPTFSDADWVSLNPGIPGANNDIYATAVDASGSLYVGGSFTFIGKVAANYIAKWNGSAWSALGSGMDSLVNALAVDANGNLYVGGFFNTAGGTPANQIAKWNGSVWSALGSGMDRQVDALAVDASGNLYAGGRFSVAGGTSANRIAKWNGNAWSALGTGMSNFVSALAVDASGNLYAGGGFISAGGTSANRIAKWDGSAWSTLGSGMNGSVYALAADSNGNLYAGGEFATAGGTPANQIAKWNGSVWSALGSGISGSVIALAVNESGTLYAAGYFTTAGGTAAKNLAKWNGSAWSALGLGFDNAVIALVVDANGNLYAGGTFTTVGGTTANRIALWDGSGWGALGSGMNDKVYALAVDASGTLYAGGTFTIAGDAPANRVAKWDGSAWSSLGTGMDNFVSALLVDASGNLYAGGDFTTAGGTAASRIAKWNGSEWNGLGTGVDAAVNALALDASGNLYAGGVFTTAGGTLASCIAKWNGNAWSALGLGMDNFVSALAVDTSGNLYAGGAFTTAGGASANYIAKWDGSAWSTLGFGMDGHVLALLLDASGNLYAGGGFSIAGETSVNYIAKWNGTVWSAFGLGMNSLVDTLAVDASGNLYAGGYFTTAGGTSANRIAKWNGSEWSAFGTGTNSFGIKAAAIDVRGNFYVGGDFTLAGTSVSPFIARANLNSSITLTPMLTAPVINALTNSHMSVVFTLLEAALPGSVKLSFGPTQLTLAASQETAGAHSFSFNPANPTATAAIASGGAIADGLYTVSLSYQDALGNPAVTVTSTNVTVDTTAPSLSPVSIVSDNANPTKAKQGSTLTLSFTANEAIETPSVTLFGIAAAVANSTDNKWTATAAVVPGTAEGTAVFSIIASDLAGNAVAAVTTTTNASGVTVDKTAPSLTLPGNIAVNTLVPNGAVVNFTLASTDALDTSPLVEATPASGNIFPVGVTTVNVTATDDAGNSTEGSFTVTVTLLLPAIAVKGKSIGIVNGDATPSQTDGTDFGIVPLLNQQVTRRFIIENVGTAPLNLTGMPKVQVTGAAAGDFRVTAVASSPVAVGSSTSMDIVFDPTLPGQRSATVSIASDDLEKPLFTFDIVGFGNLAALRPQAISFAAPTTVYLGQSPLALNATASSGLPVTLSLVSGPATLMGNSLTPTGPGTVKVLATQVGGSNYAAATAVTRSIGVKNTPIALTLLDLAQVYNGSPRPISTIGGTSPVITYKIGLAYGSTVPTAAGSYPVTVFDGAVTKTGTLVIAKAVLTVTPDNQRKFVGQANPALTAVITGYVGSDDSAVVTKAPLLKTLATLASPGGLYPITASAATALNYSFNYQQGTLVVENFAGSYEALLVDATPAPVGKLSLTVAANSKNFTGKLYTATEATALSIKGTLTPDLLNEQATGTATVTVLNGAVSYVISFTLPLQGEVLVNVTRNTLPLGSATAGRKLLALGRGQTIAYAGAHTAVLEPATPVASTVPVGAGWATASISTTGVMTLAGRLGDGTAFTCTLGPDVASDPSYRLWVQPYVAARTASFLAGELTLLPQPNPSSNASLINRRYSAATSLTWQKTGLPADAAYRSGFGPVTTVLRLDPWLVPAAAKAATKNTPAVLAITLADRLGLSGNGSPASFGVTHSETSSTSQASLPTSLGLSATNTVSVLVPLTTPPNITKWKTLTFNAITGTFTGRFELSDVVSVSPLLRPVNFSGVLRQPASESDPLIGAGHYVLPPLSGTEKTTGEISFTRP